MHDHIGSWWQAHFSHHCSLHTQPRQRHHHTTLTTLKLHRLLITADPVIELKQDAAVLSAGTRGAGNGYSSTGELIVLLSVSESRRGCTRC